MINRHLEIIYCDEIRHESNGKLLYIGVYSEVLVVKTFPITLPRLCLSIKAVTPVSEPFLTLTLRVFRDDDNLQEIIVEDDQLPSLPDFNGGSRDDLENRAQVAHFNLVFSPMHLDGPFSLRVRLETESGELEGLALRVEELQFVNQENLIQATS